MVEWRFDFNIRARLEGKKFISSIKMIKIKSHIILQRLQGFLADKRKMLDFSDRDDEVQLWQLYANKLLKNNNLEQYKFDKNFLLNLSKTFESEDV